MRIKELDSLCIIGYPQLGKTSMRYVQLEQLYSCLHKTVSAEEFFEKMSISCNMRPLTKDETNLALLYQQLLDICEGEQYEDSIDHVRIAKDARKHMQQLYQRAQEKLSQGTWGIFAQYKDVYSIETPTRKYFLPKHLVDGDLCSLYEGVCADGEGDAGRIVFKLLEKAEDASFMEREVDALRLLLASVSPYNKHLPIFLESVHIKNMNSAIVLRYFDGYDLPTLRQHFPHGLDQKHVVWIMLRALRLLGFAHSKGVLHGNIQPAHIMVRPHDHNVIVLDWCYALIRPNQTGHSFRVYSEQFSAPEVARKGDPLPSSDIYALAKTMIYLLGGDPKTSSMPDSVDERLQKLLLFCTLPSPLGRAQDAWDLHRRLQFLRGEIFGPHKFETFTINTQ